MKPIFKGILIALLLMPSLAAASVGKQAFILATVIRSEGRNMTKPNASFIDGQYDITVRVDKYLLGAKPPRILRFSVTSARPTEGGKFYILLSGKDYQDVRWFESKTQGICLDVEDYPDLSEKYRLDQLKRRYPCRR